MHTKDNTHLIDSINSIHTANTVNSIHSVSNNDLGNIVNRSSDVLKVSSSSSGSRNNNTLVRDSWNRNSLLQNQINNSNNNSSSNSGSNNEDNNSYNNNNNNNNFNNNQSLNQSFASTNASYDENVRVRTEPMFTNSKNKNNASYYNINDYKNDQNNSNNSGNLNVNKGFISPKTINLNSVGTDRERTSAQNNSNFKNPGTTTSLFYSNKFSSFQNLMHLLTNNLRM